ncbi:MAG: ABC transporter permease [Archaeoglobaceae archaeon]|nr:ABC transporter permease [Archaeoglobaceae archaeon]MCS7144477.1 ABC transporter permease [Archaeoglobaceae archaeon]MDW8118439.1 ABC transporter permease [Archaeoglobaceae archaeon]MDW8128205.1 ABC transporter permease [Archaeoglobaceae archaeon]
MFLVIWEAYYWFFIKNPFVLAPPSDVLITFSQLVIGDPKFAESGFYIPTDMLYSLYHYVLGFASAILVGFSVGLIAGWSKTVERFLYPLIELIRPIPPIAWIPIAILLLKLTHTAAAFIIFIGAVFPILLNTMYGVSSVERKYVEAALTLGATKTSVMLRKVIIPASIPAFFTGLRVGSGVAWMCVVAAELFGVSQFGLGYKIQLARLYHSPDVVISYMLAIGIIGLILDRIYRAMGNRLLKWRRGFVVE